MDCWQQPNNTRRISICDKSDDKSVDKNVNDKLSTYVALLIERFYTKLIKSTVQDVRCNYFTDKKGVKSCIITYIGFPGQSTLDLATALLP